MDVQWDISNVLDSENLRKLGYHTPARNEFYTDTYNEILNDKRVSEESKTSVSKTRIWHKLTIGMLWFIIVDFILLFIYMANTPSL